MCQLLYATWKIWPDCDVMGTIFVNYGINYISHCYCDYQLTIRKICWLFECVQSIMIVIQSLWFIEISSPYSFEYISYVSYHRNDLESSLSTLEMHLNPSNKNHFYIATDGGMVLHGTRFGSQKTVPRAYMANDSTPCVVTSVDLHPFKHPVLLVSSAGLCCISGIRARSEFPQFSLVRTMQTPFEGASFV